MNHDDDEVEIPEEYERRPMELATSDEAVLFDERGRKRFHFNLDSIENGKALFIVKEHLFSPDNDDELMDGMVGRYQWMTEENAIGIQLGDGHFSAAIWSAWTGEGVQLMIFAPPAWAILHEDECGFDDR